MTYRSALVHLDETGACGVRTAVAIRLAKALSCHLVGVAPTGLLELPAGLGSTNSLASLSAVAWDTLRDRARRATEMFAQACRAAELHSHEAVLDELDVAASLVRRAHCSDLCILSQADPSDPAYRWMREVVEEVVLRSARPTLIIPYAGRHDTLGTRAMVAWDHSREATRAVSDALPLLRRADQVDVVSWNEGSSQTQAPRADLDALQKWLMWQGVTADVHVESTQIEIAEAMLSRAADASADLIVMGAYGHSRLTERVLGGATRGLLASMTVPVLMSH